MFDNVDFKMFMNASDYSAIQSICFSINSGMLEVIPDQCKTQKV